MDGHSALPGDFGLTGWLATCYLILRKMGQMRPGMTWPRLHRSWREHRQPQLGKQATMLDPKMLCTSRIQPCRRICSGIYTVFMAGCCIGHFSRMFWPSHVWAFVWALLQVSCHHREARGRTLLFWLMVAPVKLVLSPQEPSWDGTVNLKSKYSDEARHVEQLVFQAVEEFKSSVWRM